MPPREERESFTARGFRTGEAKEILQVSFNLQRHFPKPGIYSVLLKRTKCHCQRQEVMYCAKLDELVRRTRKKTTCGCDQNQK